jgi:hypothetical protein
MRRSALLAVLLTIALLAIGFSASTASATVLCKTATNPCTGGTYGKGTALEASLKFSKMHPLGALNCAEGSIKGEVTNAGGEGTNVTGTFSNVSFSNCGSNTVTVLKPGTFKIKSPSGGNGTLVWEGFEITVIIAGAHCIYGGWLETTALSLEGGEMASLVNSNTTILRTGGMSGIICGGTMTWTAEYTVTAPEPLYVAEK